MPSSDSVTSLMLMVSSDHDACTSSILLSLKAEQRDRPRVSRHDRLFKCKQMKPMMLLSACVAGRHAAPTPTVGPEGYDFNAQLCDEVFKNS